MPYRIDARGKSYAVATLEEVKQRLNLTAGLIDADQAGAAETLFPQIDALSESGGTINLPDGTEIRVEPITRDDLWDALPTPKRPLWEMSDDDLCAAYNAAQSAESRTD